MKKGIKYIIITTAVMVYGWFLFLSMSPDMNLKNKNRFSFDNTGSSYTDHLLPVYKGVSKVNKDGHTSTYNMKSAPEASYTYNLNHDNRDKKGISAGIGIAQMSGHSFIKRNNQNDQRSKFPVNTRLLSSLSQSAKSSSSFFSQPILGGVNLIDVADYNAGDITHPGDEPGTLPCIPVGEGVYLLMLAVGIFMLVKKQNIG